MYNVPQLTPKTTQDTSAIDQITSLYAENGLKEMLSHSQLLHASHTIGGGDVYRLAWNGKDYLIKTYARRPFWIRWLLGRPVLRREYDNLHFFLQHGIQVPAPYAILGKDTLVEEYLSSAVPLLSARHYDDNTRPPMQFFEKLSAIIRDMHANGLCHGDLRRANVMIGQDVSPCLIDVATAIVLPPQPSWLRRMFFAILRRSDDFSLAKIIHSFYPELLDENHQKALHNAPWYLHLGRYIRHNIYRLLRGPHHH